MPDGTRLPDHYDDYIYLSADMDNGGVHVNSSIMNHGFYLLAAGGTPYAAAARPRGPGYRRHAGGAHIRGRWGVAAVRRHPISRTHAMPSPMLRRQFTGEDSAEWVAVHTAMDAIGIPGTWEQPPEPMAEPEPLARVPGPLGRLPHLAAPLRLRLPLRRKARRRRRHSPNRPYSLLTPWQYPRQSRRPRRNRHRRKIDPGMVPQPRDSVWFCFILAALALAGAALVAYAYRPGRSSATRWRPENQQTRSPPVFASRDRKPWNSHA